MQYYVKLILGIRVRTPQMYFIIISSYLYSYNEQDGVI